MRRSGFTLIELLAAIALIGILAAVAMGQYSAYTTKAAYVEVMGSAKVYRRAVEICALTHPLTDCDTGMNGIPASNSTQAVASVTVTDGTVTVTPENFKGISNADIYTLTPTGGGGGTAVTSWADNCATNALC